MDNSLWPFLWLSTLVLHKHADVARSQAPSTAPRLENEWGPGDPLLPMVPSEEYCDVFALPAHLAGFDDSPRELSSWSAPYLIGIYKYVVIPTTGVKYHFMYLLDTLTKYSTAILNFFKMRPTTQHAESSPLFVTELSIPIYRRDCLFTFQC